MYNFFGSTPFYQIFSYHIFARPIPFPWNYPWLDKWSRCCEIKNCQLIDLPWHLSVFQFCFVLFFRDSATDQEAIMDVNVTHRDSPSINTLKPEKKMVDIFHKTFALKFEPEGPVDNKSALVQRDAEQTTSYDINEC